MRKKYVKFGTEFSLDSFLLYKNKGLLLQQRPFIVFPVSPMDYRVVIPWEKQLVV